MLPGAVAEEKCLLRRSTNDHDSLDHKLTCLQDHVDAKLTRIQVQLESLNEIQAVSLRPETVVSRTSSIDSATSSPQGGTPKAVMSMLIAIQQTLDSNFDQLKVLIEGTPGGLGEKRGSGGSKSRPRAAPQAAEVNMESGLLREATRRASTSQRGSRPLIGGAVPSRAAKSQTAPGSRSNSLPASRRCSIVGLQQQVPNIAPILEESDPAGTSPQCGEAQGHVNGGSACDDSLHRRDAASRRTSIESEVKSNHAESRRSSCASNLVLSPSTSFRGGKRAVGFTAMHSRDSEPPHREASVLNVLPSAMIPSRFVNNRRFSNSSSASSIVSGRSVDTRLSAKSKRSKACTEASTLRVPSTIASENRSVTSLLFPSLHGSGFGSDSSAPPSRSASARPSARSTYQGLRPSGHKMSEHNIPLDAAMSYTGSTLGGSSDLRGSSDSLQKDQKGSGLFLEDEPHWFVILPTSMFGLCWSFIMLVFTVLLGIIIPIGFVYIDESSLQQGSLGALMNTADVLFALDIPINFRTAIMNGAYTETHPGTLAAKYLRKWFLFDLLAAWPLATVPVGSWLCIVVRSMKLLRLFRLPGSFLQFQKAYRSLMWPVAEVALVVLLISHDLACLWRSVLRAEDPAARLDGRILEDPDASWWSLYIEDIYWVQMTMTTVGYGDIHPVGTLSRLYCIFAMFVASMIFGATISFLTNASKGLFHNDMEKKIDDAIRFMRRRKIPEATQRRVQHNLRYRLLQDQQEHQQDLLKLLSPAVQRDLSLHLLNSTVVQFPLFRDAQHSFVAEIAQAHTWVQCLPTDCVAERGQVVEELVFVTRGHLLAQFDKFARSLDLDVCQDDPDENMSQLVSGSEGSDDDDSSGSDSDETYTSKRRSMASVSSHAHPQEKTFVAGGWFGESCLFHLKRIRSATIIAVCESELAVLTAASYHRIIKKYPKLAEQHAALESQIHDGDLDIRKLAYTPVVDIHDDNLVPTTFRGKTRMLFTTLAQRVGG